MLEKSYKENGISASPGKSHTNNHHDGLQIKTAPANYYLPKIKNRNIKSVTKETETEISIKNNSND